MRYRVIFTWIVCMLVFSCTQSKAPKKPDDLISQDKMTDILYDLYLINAAKSINKKVMEDKGFMPERYILDKYEIDSARFARSNAYYAFYSDRYLEMVEKAKSRIVTLKDSITTVEKENRLARRRADSIRRLENSKSRKRDSSLEALKPVLKAPD